MSSEADIDAYEVAMREEDERGSMLSYRDKAYRHGPLPDLARIPLPHLTRRVQEGDISILHPSFVQAGAYEMIDYAAMDAEEREEAELERMLNDLGLGLARECAEWDLFADSDEA